MLYGWEIIAWAVNTVSTWNGIVKSLFFCPDYCPVNAMDWRK